MGMNIDLFCNDGSPIGICPDDVYGRGLGGAELALVSLTEAMARRGHRVRVYNDPPKQGFFSDVSWLNRSSFDSAEVGRDVFITYRSPNQFTRTARADVRLFWSMDQYTTGNYSADVFPFVDKVVCISPYHAGYHAKQYGRGEIIGYIDLGVRLEDYQDPVQRVASRCIFCSIADRGLEVLRLAWPMIREREPYASLVITSDYRLWGSGNPGNYQHRLSWLNEPGVVFLGMVNRRELVKLQLSAKVMSYPCTYEEMFCISAAECQVAGAIPVTSDFGALATTNEFGVLLKGTDMLNRGWLEIFANKVVEVMRVNSEIRDGIMALSRKRFDWDKIVVQWEYLIHTGKFPYEVSR